MGVSFGNREYVGSGALLCDEMGLVCVLFLIFTSIDDQLIQSIHTHRQDTHDDCDIFHHVETESKRGENCDRDTGKSCS